jgi:hypothetical protein
MAIYGDGKHNENMEYNENDTYDAWSIQSDEETIDVDSELGQELIATCETYEDWSMDSDERMDDEAK